MTKIKSFLKRERAERYLALQVALGVLKRDPFLTKEQRDVLRVDVFTAHREGYKTQASGNETKGVLIQFPVRERR